MESYFVELTDIGKSHLNKEEITNENLRDDEAIIKAEYSMISAGTELSRAFALKKGFKYPVRPGYCMVGTVLEKGKNIDAEVGDKVFVNAPHSSLTRWKNTGKIQGQQILKLKDGVDPKEATAINLLLVAIQGVNLTDVKLGYTVGVFGLGNIGIMAALMYKKLGCKVIGIDPVEKRCELAKEMGLEYVISSKDQKEEINKLTDGKGLDIAADVTGIASVIITCVDCVKPYGQVLLLGSPRQSLETDVMPLLSNMHMKNLKVIGGFNKTAPVYPVDGSDNSLIRNFDIVQDLIINKDIDISKLISKTIDPKDCEEAYYDLMYNKDKVNCIIFDWNNY